MDLKHYTSRKFLLTVASLIGVFTLAGMGKLDADLGLALGVVLAFYNGADVAEKYVHMRRDNARFRRMERDDYSDYGYDDYDYHRERRY